MTFYASATGDWLENIVSLLEDNWTSANTDNTTPTIRLITDPSLPKKINFSHGDYVLIYEESSDEKPADIGYLGGRQWARISLDIRTNKGRPRVNKLYGEAGRIIKANRIHPKDGDGNSLGIDYIIWRGAKDLTNRMYRIWRLVASIEPHKQYVSVT